MWATSYLLFMFATTNGDLHFMPDPHGPFSTETDCDNHAADEIHAVSDHAPRRTMYAYVCVPFETETV